MYLLQLLYLLFALPFAEKRRRDQYFAHRAWEDGRMTDADYRRAGGDMGRRYVAEKVARRAPPAIGFRSRPFP